MRTPANDSAGHRRARWRGGDDRPADAEERLDQTGAPGAAPPGVELGDPARARLTEPAARRGSGGPQDASAWLVASRAAIGRRQVLRYRDGSDADPGGGADSDPRSVFAPDFSRAGPDSGQSDPGRLEAAGIIRTPPGGAAPPRSWYESGPAGKGPVRGYPPAPGQPLPLYPPGQFAAWNRRRRGLPQDGGPGDRAPFLATGDDNANPQAEGLARNESGDSSAGPLSKYYPPDTDPGLNPGYPTLAVSDPAADVTSTQTWRALAEGRATGIWAAPAGLLSGAGSQVAPGTSERNRAIPQTPPAGSQPVRPGTGRHTGPGGPPVVSRSPGVVPNDGDSTVTDSATSAGIDLRSGARRASSRHGGAHTGTRAGLRQASQSDSRNPLRERRPSPAAPAAADQADPGPAAGSNPQPGLASQTGRNRGRTSQRRSTRRSRPASVHLAIAAAALLILAAAGTLAYTVLHDSAKPKPAPQSTAKKAASASPSPSLGPYGHIASRQTDPQPLTVAELYPASFSVAADTVTSAATNLSSSCSDALVGATLQSAVGAADCTQVARATYVSQSGIMATIGVLNLSTGDAAKTAAQSADASDYISQLAATTGPAKNIGQGTGIEEAAAKGHYLILIWAELTSQATPSTQQTAQIESFMTALLQNTVNRDLTTRMLTGAP